VISYFLYTSLYGAPTPISSQPLNSEEMYLLPKY
jgi:hypothetical protein